MTRPLSLFQRRRVLNQQNYRRTGTSNILAVPEQGADDKTIGMPEGAEGESIVVVPEGAEDKSIVVQKGAEGETIVEQLLFSVCLIMYFLLNIYFYSFE